MISNLFDRNIIRIISYFLISPGSRYTREEIKEKTEMNNLPLDTTLTKLKSLKLVSENKRLYALNFNMEKNKDIFNILSYEYKYFNIPYKIFNLLVETAEKLSKIKGIKSVILFGSYAKMIYTENSDIDIAVITENKIKTEKINKEIRKTSSQIELHFFKQEEMKENDPLIKEILKNGKQVL